MKDPFGEKRGCFNYKSIESRLEKIKGQLDEKRILSSDSSEESDMETNEKTSDSMEDKGAETAEVEEVNVKTDS